jgi:acyl-coenzyme A thioesterase PaaI-like protein
MEEKLMSLPVTAPELQQLLQTVTFTRQYGFQLHAIADGVCTLLVPFQEAFERPGGIISGQVFMTAADVAMWLALLSKFGVADRSVTVEMTTAFLQGARREDFRCTATLMKLGKRLVYGVAECVSLTGTLLTHHTLTYARPAPA